MNLKRGDIVKLGSLRFAVAEVKIYPESTVYRLVECSDHEWFADMNATGETLLAMGAQMVTHSSHSTDSANNELQSNPPGGSSRGGYATGRAKPNETRAEFYRRIWAEGVAKYNAIDKRSVILPVDHGAHTTVSFPDDNHSPKCECGTSSVNGSKHSTWCPVKD